MVGIFAVFSFSITVLLMVALRPLAIAVGLVDVPGGRKRHDAPVPVIGGIAMTSSMANGTVLFDYADEFTLIFIGVYVLAVVGAIDDRFNLPAAARLVVQGSVALLVALGASVAVNSLGVFFGHSVALGALSLPFTVLFIIALINAFNMIDGIDGLAGGLAFIALAALAATAVHTPFFPLLTLVASVVAGYLLFNLPLPFNARVRAFMGDAGSTVLGFLVAVPCITLTQGDATTLSPVVALWFVAIPAFDLCTVVIRRAQRGLSPFAADREHMHHKLADEGLPKSLVLALMLAFAAAIAGAGLLGSMLGASDSVMLVLWTACGIAYYRASSRPAVLVSAVTRALRLNDSPAPSTTLG